MNNPEKYQKNKNILDTQYDLNEFKKYNFPLWCLNNNSNKKNKDDKNSENFTKSDKYDKNEIKIFDNLICDKKIKEIHEFCKNSALYCKHGSINTKRINSYLDESITDNCLNKRWPTFTMYFSRINGINNEYFNNFFFEELLPKLPIKNKEYICIDRLYINTHLLGRTGLYHKDGKSKHEKNKLNTAPTVLIYLNDNWNIDYDATTCFLPNDFDESDVFHIELKCGRIVMFPSYISHKQCETSTYSYRNNTLRYVLAYHLIYNQTFDKY